MFFFSFFTHFPYLDEKHDSLTVSTALTALDPHVNFASFQLKAKQSFAGNCRPTLSPGRLLWLLQSHSFFLFVLIVGGSQSWQPSKFEKVLV